MVGLAPPLEIPLKYPYSAHNLTVQIPRLHPQGCVCRVNIRYYPLMLSICLLNFVMWVLGTNSGLSPNTGLGGEHTYSVSHLTRLLHFLRVYTGPGADQSGLAKEQGQGSSCLASQEHAMASSFSRAVLES